MICIQAIVRCTYCRAGTRVGIRRSARVHIGEGARATLPPL